MPRNESNRTMVIVVYIPYAWAYHLFDHRRRPTEALAVPLRGSGAVLVVEPSVCPVTGWFRKEERGKVVSILRKGRVRQVQENLYVMTPFVWLPVRLQFLRWIKGFNWKMMARQIRKTVRCIFPQVDHVVSWFYRPDHVNFVGLAGEDKVVYECYDKHHTAGMLSIPGIGERVQKKEQELLSKAHIVFTTSETLWQEKRKLHPCVFMFPNAADADFFAKVQASDTAVAEAVKKLRHPIIGYLGTIHRDIDIELLRYVAEVKPAWTLLIAGEVVDKKVEESDDYRRFRSLPNAQLVGWIREEIPEYFKGVDVCLIPFRMDSVFNQYRNPNKLHEYTAMGKAVVSTDIPCIHSHSDIIYIGRTKEEFVACIKQALAEDGPERVDQRLRWARENTWEKRAERMLDIIETSLWNIAR
jgi:hypothetical protein